MTTRFKLSATINAPSRERGLALLVVLWIIVAAALVVSAFNAAVKSGVSFVDSEIVLAKADALLDAGAEIAAARLVDEEESRHWVPDGTPHTIAFAGARIAIAIADAGGRVDLNKADPQLLMGLLGQFADSERQAARIRDHILLARGEMPGDGTRAETAVGTMFEGGESANSGGEVPAFVDVAQLRTLDGMTVKLYRQIAPHLTVYSGDGRINPLSASEIVLKSIPELAEPDFEKLRAYMRSPEQSESMMGDLDQRFGSYLAEKAGPAFVVSVEVLQADGSPGASSVYVMAPGLDKDAPYRLIAKRPTERGLLSDPT